MKLHRVIVMLRDENVDLRAKNIDIQTDYVILDESYKNFITVSMLSTENQAKERHYSQSLRKRLPVESIHILRYTNINFDSRFNSN